MITKLVPLEIVARIMGHNGTAMLKKHYARIIKEEVPNTALIISKILGIDYEEPNEIKTAV